MVQRESDLLTNGRVVSCAEGDLSSARLPQPAGQQRVLRKHHIGAEPYPRVHLRRPQPQPCHRLPVLAGKLQHLIHIRLSHRFVGRQNPQSAASSRAPLGPDGPAQNRLAGLGIRAVGQQQFCWQFAWFWVGPPREFPIGSAWRRRAKVAAEVVLVARLVDLRQLRRVALGDHFGQRSSGNAVCHGAKHWVQLGPVDLLKPGQLGDLHRATRRFLQHSFARLVHCILACFALGVRGAPKRADDRRAKQQPVDRGCAGKLCRMKDQIRPHCLAGQVVHALHEGFLIF